MKIAIAGAGGRMGRMLIEATLQDAEALLTAAIDQPDSAVLGKDAGELVGMPVFGLGEGGDVTAGDRAGGERRGDALVLLAEDGSVDQDLGARSGDVDLPDQPAHRRALPVGLPAAGEIPPAQGADELGLGSLGEREHLSHPVRVGQGRPPGAILGGDLF